MSKSSSAATQKLLFIINEQNLKMMHSGSFCRFLTENLNQLYIKIAIG